MLDNLLLEFMHRRDSIYLHEHVLFIDIPSTHTYIHCFLTVIT